MRIKAVIGALAAVAALAAPSFAQQGPSLAPAPAASKAVIASPGPSAPATHTLSKDDAEAWLDGYMPYALQRGGVAGAVVVIVKDGQVLLQKGYGYADVAKQRPVDPETTLFRPGSVSKLFTWTAVMQQVEAGKIDLDRDVNSYLDFKLAPYHGQPVTVRNLMTHTGGFEESVKNLIIKDPKDLAPLGDVLKKQMPARIFPPGQVPAYSNYGAALAGYIVERVSGQPFDDYVDQHIFAPLGMKYATFRQPLPPGLKPFMAKGYKTASDPAEPYEMIDLAPAGSSAVSGADMARFMIAHLQDGAYNGQRILQARTAQMMHGTPLTIIPPLHRMLLGFYETDRNGHRIIGHGGDLQYFHSDLQLYPNDHVGIFVSFNSVGQDHGVYPAREALANEFTDRYFPGPAPTGHVDASTAQADARAMAGHYEPSRRSQTNFLSLLYLLQQSKVTTDKDGHLVASALTDLSGQPKKFEEIAPFVWREVGGKERLAAKLKDGKVQMWAEDSASPFEVFLPVPAYANGAWLLPALEASIAALLLTGLLWPVNALVRRRYGAAFPLQGLAAHGYRYVHGSALAAGALMVAWFVTLNFMFQTFSLSSAMDPWILVLHLLSIVVFPVTAVAAVWNAWLVCTGRKGVRSAFAWVWSVVVALAALVLLWVALLCHLIGLGVNF